MMTVLAIGGVMLAVMGIVTAGVMCDVVKVGMPPYTVVRLC